MKKFILFLLLSMFLFLYLKAREELQKCLILMIALKSGLKSKAGKLLNTLSPVVFLRTARQRVSFSGITVDIEILEVSVIDGGIKVLARAWDT